MLSYLENYFGELVFLKRKLKLSRSATRSGRISFFGTDFLKISENFNLRSRNNVEIRCHRLDMLA